MATIHRDSITFSSQVSYTLVWPDSAEGKVPLLLALHGYGDDGERLEARLGIPADAPYAVLIPDGPYPVEIRNEDTPRVGRSWYQYTGDQPAFLESLRVSSGYLDRLLEGVAKSHPVDLSRVVLFGYSQGGYLAGYHALHSPSSVRGLIAAACRIKVESFGDALEEVSSVKVMVIHGKKDRAVLLEPQEKSVEVLRENGFDVEFLMHDGGHGLPRSVSPAIDEFVKRCTSST